MDGLQHKNPEQLEADITQLKVLSRQVYLDLQRAKARGDAEGVKQLRQWIFDLTYQQGELAVEAGFPPPRWLAEGPRPGATREEKLAYLQKLEMFEELIRLMHALYDSLGRKDYERADRVLRSLAELGDEDPELYGIERTEKY